MVERPGTAIGFTIVAVALFTLMDVLVKWEAPRFAIIQIVFFRSVFALVPLGVVLLKGRDLRPLRANNITGHIVRSLVGVAAMVSVFTAYSLMKISDAIAITFAAPLFATALSVPMLGERVGLHRWTAVVVGFIGVLIIVRPGTTAFDWAAVFAIAGAACIGVTTIYVRKLTRTETTEAIVLYFTLTTTACAAVALPFVWVTPGPLDLALLIAIGLLGGTAQIFRTKASKLADIAILAPFSYTALLWAMLLGWLIWDELPDGYTVLGASIVAASGIYIVFRETRLGHRRGWRWLHRASA